MLTFNRIILIISCFFIFSGIIFWRYQKQHKWARYYHEYIYKPTRKVVAEAIEKFTKEEKQAGLALDLGSGSGNESIYLLQQGWHVFAIDNQPEAINALSNREDLTPDMRSRLTMRTVGLEELDWDKIPVVDLIIASYSLPFINPDAFQSVWQQIVAHIKPGGRFVGHFFGPKFKGLRVNTPMSFIEKEQVKKFFDEFIIEKFEETDKDVVHEGYPMHEHIFEIIAQKKDRAIDDSDLKNN